MHLQYTLISDGSSDTALLPILEDALLKYSRFSSFHGQRADFARYNIPLKKLEDRIDCAIDLYNPGLLFIHRDAEKVNHNIRFNEIDVALARCRSINKISHGHIKVIPVKMTEAWLLIDESAIKSASNNPNGKEKLNLPPINKLEDIPNPKQVLENLIKQSSGLSKRRLKKLNTRHAIQLVARYIEDFSVLERVPSYQFLMEEIRNKLN